MRYKLHVAALKRGISLSELSQRLKERYSTPSLKKITLKQYKEFYFIVRALPKVVE
jgi:hypothetical protein